MAKAMDTASFQSLQPRYNMIDRGIEGEDISFCREHGIGILAHSPLAKGLLTGKYEADHTFPDEDERSMFPRFKGDLFRNYISAANKLAAVASDKGVSLVQMALAWILRLPEISSVLVGGKSAEQVAEHVGAASIDFTEEDLHRIDTILTQMPEEH
jgi:aryl-alcohol dehydrogenase-like predicted oxidoreductase